MWAENRWRQEGMIKIEWLEVPDSESLDFDWKVTLTPPIPDEWATLPEARWTARWTL
jgi:hypothetical protein